MKASARKLEAGVFEALQIEGEFLPDFKTAPALLAVLLVSELLAIVLAVAHYGLGQFSWAGLGLISIFVQWVVLASILLIAPLRPWLNRASPAVAGLSCFAIVQAITLIFAGIALFNYGQVLGLELANVADYLIISAIFSGIGLRYMYLQQQVRNQQQARLKSQLQALQSRIQPHFLFNCMNTIASLIEIDPPKAERAVEDLSELFRASLAEPKLVPVADEVALCERYLDIEKLRMGERLQITWAIEDEAMRAPIPSLILQPLLENGIKHGLAPLPEGGTIEVTVLIRDQQLHLSVANPVAEGASVKGHQLALNNVLARLQGHFGEQVDWAIERSEGRYEINIHYGLKNF